MREIQDEDWDFRDKIDEEKPKKKHNAAPVRRRISEFEKFMIFCAFFTQGGDVQTIAKSSHISRKSVYRLLKNFKDSAADYGLQTLFFRGARKNKHRR